MTRPFEDSPMAPHRQGPLLGPSDSSDGPSDVLGADLPEDNDDLLPVDWAFSPDAGAIIDADLQQTTAAEAAAGQPGLDAWQQPADSASRHHGGADDSLAEDVDEPRIDPDAISDDERLFASDSDSDSE